MTFLTLVLICAVGYLTYAILRLQADVKSLSSKIENLDIASAGIRSAIDETAILVDELKRSTSADN